MDKKVDTQWRLTMGIDMKDFVELYWSKKVQR